MYQSIFSQTSSVQPSLLGSVFNFFSIFIEFKPTLLSIPFFLPWIRIGLKMHLLKFTWMLTENLIRLNNSSFRMNQNRSFEFGLPVDVKSNRKPTRLCTIWAVRFHLCSRIMFQIYWLNFAHFTASNLTCFLFIFVRHHTENSNYWTYLRWLCQRWRGNCSALTTWTKRSSIWCGALNNWTIVLATISIKPNRSYQSSEIWTIKFRSIRMRKLAHFWSQFGNFVFRNQCFVLFQFFF